MSLDPLPRKIERDVERFASDHRISHDEAVLQLIKDGLKAQKQEPSTGESPPPGLMLVGMFSSPEDRAIFDEAMKFARRFRRARYRKL